MSEKTAYAFNHEAQKKIVQIALMLLGYFSILIVLGANTYASDSDGLTSIFRTDAFRGSMEVIKKADWIGVALQWCISIFSLIALVSIAWQKIATLLYLAARPTFDRVHEIKSDSMNQKFFGVPDMFSKMVNSKNGTGVDALVFFLLGLLPDLEEYCEYSENARKYNNLEETDGVTQFMLKTALPTILMIFFFSMGYNGTLMQAYGNVADALGYVAERFVSIQLDDQLAKLTNKQKNYTFGYNTSSKLGASKQATAKKMYSTAVSAYIKQAPSGSKSLTESELATLGQNIEKIVNKIYEQSNPSSTTYLAVDANNANKMSFTTNKPADNLIVSTLDTSEAFCKVLAEKINVNYGDKQYYWNGRDMQQLSAISCSASVGKQSSFNSDEIIVDFGLLLNRNASIEGNTNLIYPDSLKATTGEFTLTEGSGVMILRFGKTKNIDTSSIFDLPETESNASGNTNTNSAVKKDNN